MSPAATPQPFDSRSTRKLNPWRAFLAIIVLILVAWLLIGAFASAFGKEGPKEKQATIPQPQQLDANRLLAWGPLRPVKGSEVAGTVRIFKESDDVELRMTVINAKPGTHAVAIEAAGTCKPESVGAKGTSLNEGKGKPATGETDVISIGNIAIGTEGEGRLVIKLTPTSFPELSQREWQALMGRAVTVHEPLLGSVKDKKLGKTLACANLVTENRVMRQSH